jgi:hypothetical protein
MLFMTKADEAHAFGLRKSRQIGNRNADQPKDGIEVVQLQGVDDQMETVGGRRCFLLRCLGCSGGLRVVQYFCHNVSPPWLALFGL